MSGAEKEVEAVAEGEDEVPEIAEADGPPTHDPFNVKVFFIAKGQQSANGLRHNDHLRYRQYCTRRLRRLRCTLRWKNGKGRGKQVPFPNDFADWRYLEFPLVCAERAWSYGVQLKADNATANTWNPRWRLHSIRRFAKAVQWAEFLEKCCKVHADQRTQREAEAYTSFMAGTLLLEKEEWQEALTKLTRCKKLCEHLGLASDQAENKIFKEHAAELAPAIRECRYNLGMAAESDEEDAAAGGAKPKGKQAKKDLSGFGYRGHDLVKPPEKIKAGLVKCLALAGSVKADDAIETSDAISKYGELSAEFGDVLKDMHDDMIKGGDKEAGSEGPSESEWRLLEAFAREHSLCMNVERNLVLLTNLLGKLDTQEDIGSTSARKTCRPEEGMRYCDLLKEDLESLKELPETSAGISKALSTYITIALNGRCFFLALCHVLTGKTLESAALFEMLRSRLEDTVMGAALEQPLGRIHPLFDRVVKGMPARVSQWRCRGLALLCSKGSKAKSQEDEGQDAASAAQFPPKPREIPCKPLLFDLAFPCMEAPDLEEILPKGKAAGGADGEKKGSILGKVAGGVGNVAGGIGSRLSGLWGRGQK